MIATGSVPKRRRSNRRLGFGSEEHEFVRPTRAPVGTGPRFREMRAYLGPPTDRCLHMTVRVTDELSTQPRATQRGFQDDKRFKNTLL
jgi:hypothetical protein